MSGHFLTKKRLFLLVLTVIALVVLGYVTWSAAQVELPPEFTVGRERAAVLSGRIVEITAAVNERIKEANQNDLGGNPEVARALLQEARDRNYEAYRKAMELADELEAVAASLEDIRPGESQRLAYQAVSLELMLVQEYLAYTDSLNQFLDTLTRALGITEPTTRRAIDEAIAEVNQRGGTINRMNQLFVEKLQELDQSL